MRSFKQVDPMDPVAKYMNNGHEEETTDAIT